MKKILSITLLCSTWLTHPMDNSSDNNNNSNPKITYGFGGQGLPAEFQNCKPSVPYEITPWTVSFKSDLTKEEIEEITNRIHGKPLIPKGPFKQPTPIGVVERNAPNAMSKVCDFTILAKLLEAKINEIEEKWIPLSKQLDQPITSEITSEFGKFVREHDLQSTFYAEKSYNLIVLDIEDQYFCSLKENMISQETFEACVTFARDQFMIIKKIAEETIAKEMDKNHSNLE